MRGVNRWAVHREVVRVKQSQQEMGESPGLSTAEDPPSPRLKGQEEG